MTPSKGTFVTGVTVPAIAPRDVPASRAVAKIRPFPNIFVLPLVIVLSRLANWPKPSTKVDIQVVERNATADAKLPRVWRRSPIRQRTIFWRQIAVKIRGCPSGHCRATAQLCAPNPRFGFCFLVRLLVEVGCEVCELPIVAERGDRPLLVRARQRDKTPRQKPASSLQVRPDLENPRLASRACVGRAASNSKSRKALQLRWRPWTGQGRGR